MYSIVLENLTQDNSYYIFKEEELLKGKAIFHALTYHWGLIKLMDKCIWCFLFGDKMRIPNFLIETIEYDYYDFDGLYPITEDYLKIIRTLEENDVIKIEPSFHYYNPVIRKQIFDSAYKDYMLFINDYIKTKTYLKVGSFYQSFILMNTLQNYLHKHYSIRSNTPIVLIDNFDDKWSHLPLFKSSDSNKLDFINKIQSLYIPNVSIFSSDSEIMNDKFEEKLKERIELVHLIKNSPLNPIIQDYYKSIYQNSDFDIDEKDQIILLKEFLKNQQSIKTIKKVAFLGDKATEIPSLLNPFIGAFNILNKNAAKFYSKNRTMKKLQKLSDKLPGLKHIYFKENDIPIK